MSQPIEHRIGLLGSPDWSLRRALLELVPFLDPVLEHGGRRHRIEWRRIVRQPFACGEDLRRQADLVIDRASHRDGFYRNWAFQAVRCGVQVINDPFTFDHRNKHDTYDALVRMLHPADRMPITVALPTFFDQQDDPLREARWIAEREAETIATRWGFDPERRQVDQALLDHLVDDHRHMERRHVRLQEEFGTDSDPLLDAIERHGLAFPLYLKKTEGGGGSQVYLCHDLETLRGHYEGTRRRPFHLQEAVTDHDLFVRSLAIGPQLLPLTYHPERSGLERYGRQRPTVDLEMTGRLRTYVDFLGAHYRWSLNAFEALRVGSGWRPIDFANGCPDFHLTSLHVHFPWVVLALVRWLSFCVVTGKDLQASPTAELRALMSDPTFSPIERFERSGEIADAYFEREAFDEFCQTNFGGLEERMVDYYDQHFEALIDHTIEWSYAPREEHPRRVAELRQRMEEGFRADPLPLLSP